MKNNFVFYLLLFLVLPQVLAAQQQAHQKARQSQQLKDYELAIEAYLKAEKTELPMLRAYREYAGLLKKEQRMEAAYQAQLKAYDLSPYFFKEGDEECMQLLMELARLTYATERWALAKNRARHYVNLRRSMDRKDKPDLIEALSITSRAYLEIDYPETGMRYAKRGLKIARAFQVQNQWVADFQEVMVDGNWQVGNYKNALEIWAKDWYPSLRNDAARARALYLKAQYLMQWDKAEEAIQALEKSQQFLKSGKALNSPEGAQIQLAQWHLMLKEMELKHAEEQLNSYFQGLSFNQILHPSIKDSLQFTYQVYGLESIQLLCHHQNNYKKALQYAKQQLQIAEKLSLNHQKRALLWALKAYLELHEKGEELDVEILELFIQIKKTEGWNTNLQLKEIQSQQKSNQGLFIYAELFEECFLLTIYKDRIDLMELDLEGGKLSDYSRPLLNNIANAGLFYRSSETNWEEYLYLSHKLYQMLLEEPLKKAGDSLQFLRIWPGKETSKLPFEALTMRQDTMVSKDNFQDLSYLIKNYELVYGPPKINDEAAFQPNTVFNFADLSIRALDSSALMKALNEVELLIAKVDFGDSLNWKFLRNANMEKLAVFWWQQEAGPYLGTAYQPLSCFQEMENGNTLVAGLWPQADSQTLKLAQAFFVNIEMEECRSAALRNSKLKFLETNQQLQAQPFYWAGWQLWGRSATLNFPEKKQEQQELDVRWVYWLATALGTTIIGSFAYWRSIKKKKRGR